MIPTRSLWHLALFRDLVVGDKLPRQASLITICNTTIQIKVEFCFIWRLVDITDDSDTKAQGYHTPSPDLSGCPHSPHQRTANLIVGEIQST